MDECMRQGLLAHDLTLKLRLAGVYYIKDVKRAVLEPNGQLTIIQYGEENARYPLILDGQVDEDILELIEKDHVWLNATLRDAGYELKNVYVGEYKDGHLRHLSVRVIVKTAKRARESNSFAWLCLSMTGRRGISGSRSACVRAHLPSSAG